MKNTIAMIVRNHKNEMLVQYHVKLKAWTMPIGHVEEDEHPLDALKREAFEELGIEPSDVDFLCAAVIENKEYPADSGNFVSFNQHYYDICRYDGYVYNKEPEKCKELKWIPESELGTLSPTSAAFQWYIENYCK